MKISIITVSFNSEKTIKDTFESILKQSYRPLQYIVIDGGSTDSTLAIIKKYLPVFKDNDIDFSYVSEKDQGISDAFNKGIKRTNGEIIGIINSDDKLTENSLSILEEYIDDHTEVYYGQCYIFGKENQRYLVMPKHNLDLLRWEMCLYHPSCFISKTAYEQFGDYDIELKYCMDRELFLRYFVNGCNFKYIDKPLAEYREGGVNQKYYYNNLKEGYRITVKYGKSKLAAALSFLWKFIRYKIWIIVQRMGGEKFFHKKA